MNKILLAVALGVACALAQAQPQPVRIGYVNTFSGPNSFIGNDQKDGLELALDHLGRKMGGRPVQVIYEDDQMKPETGRQATEKLIKVDKVDFLTGYNWSNVLLASLKPAVDGKIFLISGNAGPHQLAGEACSPWLFSASWQNDQTGMAMGEALNKRGVKRLYMLAPNYAAGRDMVSGVKRTFKGQVVGEEYTRWPGQVDFSTELSKLRAAGPDAAWIFYPGQAGVQFIQQYAQAGLKDRVPLYSIFTVDALTLPQLGAAADGHISTQTWVQDLDNPQNARFVKDFRAKYKRYPSYYSAQNYDAAMLVASAVEAVKGDLSDKDAVRAALRKANFRSVRGKFRFNHNHIPIADIYLQKVAADDSGAYTQTMLEVVLKDSVDPYHDKCPMRF